MPTIAQRYERFAPLAAGEKTNRPQDLNSEYADLSITSSPAKTPTVIDRWKNPGALTPRIWVLQPRRYAIGIVKSGYFENESPQVAR
jgi:hypothetical protein